MRGGERERKVEGRAGRERERERGRGEGGREWGRKGDEEER